MNTIIKIRLFAGLILLSAAIMIWGWVLWPVPTMEKTIDFPVITTSVPRFETVVDQINRRELLAQLVYPTRLHSGEAGEITVQIKKSGALLASDNISDPVDQSSDGLVMVEGRIDMPLVQMDPPASIQETFSLEKLPGFSWQIKSAVKGSFTGQFWFYLLFVAPDGSIDRQALLCIPIDIAEQDLLGLPENVLVWLAVILSMAGMIVFPISVLFKHKPSESYKSS